MAIWSCQRNSNSKYVKIELESPKDFFVHDDSAQQLLKDVNFELEQMDALDIADDTERSINHSVCC